MWIKCLVSGLKATDIQFGLKAALRSRVNRDIFSDEVPSKLIPFCYEVFQMIGWQSHIPSLKMSYTSRYFRFHIVSFFT